MIFLINVKGGNFFFRVFKKDFVLWVGKMIFKAVWVLCVKFISFNFWVRVWIKGRMFMFWIMLKSVILFNKVVLLYNVSFYVVWLKYCN